MNFSGYNNRRIPDWNELLIALRGNQWQQAVGSMCIDGEDAVALDALGVMNDVAGADWLVMLPEAVIACDQEGETEMPSAEWVDVLGLNEVVYFPPEDFAYYWFSVLEEEPEPTRKDYIAYMNDVRGMKLDKIADEIERLGWNDGR